MKTLMENSDFLSTYLQNIIKKSNNPNNTDHFYKTRDKILKVRNEFKNTMQYPFNDMYDYIISIYGLFDQNTEKNKILFRIDKEHVNKNIIFLGLKNL